MRGDGRGTDNPIQYRGAKLGRGLYVTRSRAPGTAVNKYEAEDARRCG